jgi:GntR family transcriptional repressor for pyruvate dehydrogenase complex
MSALKPVKKTKVYEAAMSQLLALIEDGTYAKGERLPTERELTEKLGISRASVRQALAGLQALRLVESRPGEGTYVTSRSDERWQTDVASALETLEGRRYVEAGTARFAAERRTDDELEQLRDIVAVMDEQVREGVHPIETDRDFHRVIAAAAHSDFLLQAMEVLADRMSSPEWHRMKLWGLRSPEQTARIQEQHWAIFTAIEAQAPDAAEARMVEHIETITADVLVAEQAKTAVGRGENGAAGEAVPPVAEGTPLPR